MDFEALVTSCHSTLDEWVGPRDQNKVGPQPIPLKFGEGHQNVNTKGHGNVGLFQYLKYERY